METDLIVVPPLDGNSIEMSVSRVPASCYRCPGETEDISEGVHLSRLSSFYHKCRHCEHRTDITRLAPSLKQQWEQLLQTPETPSLFQTNGVRGLYLNQLTRNEASQVAAAFASTLREVAEIWRARHPAPPSRWLKVVFGHDCRPSSPDLAIAAATTLKQHGCQLIDLGWSVRPQLDSVLRASGADGAFFVTGHGAASGWNGFDLIGPDGIVWSQGGVLDLVELQFHKTCPRTERDFAPQTLLDATEEPLTQLRKQLHGLRPLRVAVKTTEPSLKKLLIDSQPDWPGELVVVHDREWEAPVEPLLSRIPRRRSNGWQGQEALRMALTGAATHSPFGPFATPTDPATLILISEHPNADVTFQLGEDARQVSLRDESGQTVPVERVLFGLGELLLNEHPHVDVVLSDALFDRCGWTVERCGPGYLVFHRGGTTEEQLVRTMHSLNSSLGLDGEGRYWIRREGHIHCDGLLTLTMILGSLSRTDGAVSGWCQR